MPTDNARSHMQTMLLFTGKNCPACSQLKNRIKYLELTDKVTEVDTGTEDGMQQAKEYDIRAIPAILVLKDGAVQDVLRGAMHSDGAIKGFINSGETK